MNVIKEQIQALPRGSILLHIGPHKTGTTSLQAALRENSATLKAHGVEYLTQDTKPAANRVARSLLRLPFIGKEVVPYAEWEQFAQEINQSDAPRIILSGEEFSFCGSKEIHELARTFGLDRLHVVITIRPIARILPSHWQLDLRAGATTKHLDDWLQEKLHPSLAQRCASMLGLQKSFWFLHRHDALYQRWAKILGRRAVTVVIVDEANPNAQYEVFEKLLGVPSGTVRGSTLRNSSMKELEAHTLLQVYSLLKSEGWAAPRFKRAEFVEYLKRAGYESDQDLKMLLPEWSRIEVGKISESIAAVLRGSGVRLIGNVALLNSNEIQTSNPVNETKTAARVLARRIVDELKLNRRFRRRERFEAALKVYRKLIRKIRNL
jgi:hypothetical protein